MSAPLNVIKVPGEHRSYLLMQKDDVYIEGDDHEEHWRRPSSFEMRTLHDFLTGKYPSAPKRFWRVRVGTQMGWDKEGVYIHELHAMRYFGILREVANVVLAQDCPEAAPKYAVHKAGENSTENFMRTMLNDLPALSDDVRYKLLYASFVRADRNKNGMLSRPELGVVLRKVMFTLKAKEVEEIMREADEDSDGQINYKEFSDWMHKSAHATMNKHMQSSLRDDADIVKATFRMWDKDGDGLIVNQNLCKALVKIFPNATEKQLVALTDTIDADDSGNVDYHEFVDFLFHRHKAGKAEMPSRSIDP
jgi:Ca2+-binding EF-hand superfamily protein